MPNYEDLITTLHYHTLSSYRHACVICDLNLAQCLQTHFVTIDACHLRRPPLGKWTGEYNLDWQYTQTPIDCLPDTSLRLQAIPV
jgi:hypothetical protein